VRLPAGVCCFVRGMHNFRGWSERSKNLTADEDRGGSSTAWDE